MCTMITEKIDVAGSGKGSQGWFTIDEANVSYDHPFNAPMEHTLNLDFISKKDGFSNRVAVELSTEAAKDLVRTITAVLAEAENGGHIVD